MKKSFKSFKSFTSFISCIGRASVFGDYFIIHIYDINPKANSSRLGAGDADAGASPERANLHEWEMKIWPGCCSWMGNPRIPQRHAGKFAARDG